MISKITLYETLNNLVHKPECWEAYTAETLWTDPHISKQMLAFHLDPDSAPASRHHAFIDASASWIAEKFRLSGGIRIADFGCGPGLYAQRFAEAGAKVTGIDFSARSLTHAREQALAADLEIEYRQGNYLDMELVGKFELITLIYCDFCALSPAQRARLLSRFSEHLAPGGSLLLDVFTMAAFTGRGESSEIAQNLMGGFWSADDYIGMRQTWKYEEDAVILDKYDIVEVERSRAVYNWLQYFDRELLASEFEAAGLRITEWFGDVSGCAADDEGDTLAVVAQTIDS